MTNNPPLLNAAISGALGGAQERWLEFSDPLVYDAFVDAVNAFANAVDAAIAPIGGGATFFDVQTVQELAAGVTSTRLLTSTNQADYVELANALAALFQQARIGVVSPVFGTGGGGGIQGTYPFSDLSTLVAEEGAIVQVEENLGLYQYTVTQTLTPSGTQVVNSSAGQWQRIQVPVLQWVRQTSWFIDPAGGSDIATGASSGAPIKTWAEFKARTNGGELQAATTVTLLGSLSEAITWEGSANASGSLRIVSDSSTWTLIASGTVTSFTAFSVASTQSARMFDTGASFNVSMIGKRVRFTSGAANGCRAFILSVPSGTELELAGMPQTLDTTTTLTPGAGSTYAIEDLPSVPMVAVSIDKPYSGAAASSAFYVNELNLTAGVWADVSALRMNACRLSSSVSAEEIQGSNRLICNGCGVFRLAVGNYIFTAVNPQFNGGGGTHGLTFAGLGSAVVMSSACTFRGAALATVSGTFNIQNVLVFDSTGAALTLIRGAVAICFNNGLGGNGNATFGVDVQAASQFIYTTKPTVTGSSPGVNDVNAMGLPKPWSFFASTGIIGGAQGYAAGDLAGTFPDPTVAAVTVSGPTRLAFGAVLDGQGIVRSGTNFIGANLTALTASTPANVTKSAAVVGVDTTAARSDHKHDIDTAAAVSVGTANAEGSTTSLARANHTHQVTGLHDGTNGYSFLGAFLAGGVLVSVAGNFIIPATLFKPFFKPADALYALSNIPTFNVEQGTNFPAQSISFSADGQLCFWQFGAQNYFGQPLNVTILWCSSSTSGNITYAVQLAAITGGDAQSVLTKSFAAESSSGAVSPNGTADGLVATTFSLANLDGLAGNDLFWIRLRRSAGSITGRVLGVYLS